MLTGSRGVGLLFGVDFIFEYLDSQFGVFFLILGIVMVIIQPFCHPFIKSGWLIFYF